MEEKTYYDWLFGETEEEKEIREKIDLEREWFERQPAFKKHEENMRMLLDRLAEAGKCRRKEAEKHRPKRKGKIKPKTEEEMAEFRENTRKAKEARIEALPDELKGVIRAYESLDDAAKKVFQQETWAYSNEYGKYKDPKTTKKDMKELLEILVQTTIDFINERGLTDVYSVTFGADDLQGSAKYGEWEPCTDASIHVSGLGTEKGKDGREYSVIQNIGGYM